MYGWLLLGAGLLLEHYLFEVPKSTNVRSALPRDILSFQTRNKPALDAVIRKMIADPALDANPIGPLKMTIDRLSYYGLVDEIAPLVQKFNALKASGRVGVDRTVKFQGW